MVNIETLENKVKKLNAELDHFRNIESNEKSINEMKECIEEMEEQVEICEELVDEFEPRIETLEKSEVVIKKDIKTINDKINTTNEKVSTLDSEVKSVNDKVNNIKVYNDSEIKKDLGEQKTQLKQASLDIKKLDKQKADKEHKHGIDDIEGLPAFLNNIKTTGPVAVGGYTKGVRSIVPGTGITIDETDPRHPIINSTGGGGASSLEVTQNAHGFIALDWLYFDDADSTYKKAQADSDTTLGMRHVVEVIDANTFKIAKDGVHEITNTLDLGEYVLSDTTAGGYTQTVPGDLGNLILYGMEVVSGTEVSFYTVPAITVGSEVEGVGTTNEIAYWSNANTLGALPIATYPSLTELSYVKGVTSAIQTQLNGKEPAKGSDDNYVTDAQLVVISNTSGTNTGDQDLSGLLPKAGGTVTGAIVLDENASLQLDGSLSADGKWSGTTITGTAGYTQAFGDLVYLDPTDSRWEAVDISVAAGANGDARGLLGMVVSAGTDGTACTILLQGTIRADANFPTLTIGAPVYASTSGDIVVTQPVTTDYVIRIVGSALTADSIYFSPGASWTTHT